MQDISNSKTLTAKSAYYSSSHLTAESTDGSRIDSGGYCISRLIGGSDGDSSLTARTGGSNLMADCLTARAAKRRGLIACISHCM